MGTGNRDRRHLRAGGAWRYLLVLTALLALALSSAAARPAGAAADRAFVPDVLRQAALERPSETLHVIVTARDGVSPGELKNDVMRDERGKRFAEIRREFKHALDGVAADLTGAELLYLAGKPGVQAITPDAPVKPVSTTPLHLWPQAVGITQLPELDRKQERKAERKPVAIAVVDTGIDRSRALDFGDRVVHSEGFASLPPARDTGTDYSGHGTMVAGIAAASGAYPGAAPAADIVSLRVMNEEGRAVVSDVVAAVDWIFQNRKRLNIRVVNLSLRSPFPNYAFQDPLNEAVRRLWLSGTVVVAAAGNEGSGRMLYAPASEPFVITVGAVDIAGTASVADDKNAPWTSRGYTAEGFAKPELGAPGRYMIGPVSENSKLAAAFPERAVAPGYMWMSGTSFAAPVVAGAAAQLLTRHPDWTPDQVKGALMLTARGLPGAESLSVGVGEIDVAAAAALTAPPNPNAALNRFLYDAKGKDSVHFDAGAWNAAVALDASWDAASWDAASWDAASWSDASWSDASWDAASWDAASWSDASWDAASWDAASWDAASWSDASWSDASWSDASAAE